MEKTAVEYAHSERLARLVRRLTGGRFLRAVWPILYRRSAEIFMGRITYGIRDLGSVGPDEKTGELAVRYFPRRENGTLDSMAYFELFADESRDDHAKKVLDIVFLTALMLLPALIVLTHDWVLKQVDVRMYLMDLFWGTFVVLALCVVFVFWLRVHFLNMDSHWRTSIRRLLAADIRTKMFGIKESVSSFRQFVKWRRLMSYFFVFAGAWLAVQIPVLWWLAWHMKVEFSWPQIWFVVAIVLGQAFCILGYSFLVWFYASLRDPTLQLCVMLVETDRDVVAALRPGGRLPD